MAGTTPETADKPAPPRIPGMPLLGNSLQLAREPAQFFVTAHARHGPAFRVNILFRD